jgi:hypothetical protein
MTKKMHILPALGTLFSLLLLPSCSTESSARSRFTAAVALHKDAGRPGPLVMMIGLPRGGKLPFLLDTGAPVTCLDESLEPRLGKRLGTVTANNFGVASAAVPERFRLAAVRGDL